MGKSKTQSHRLASAHSNFRETITIMNEQLLVSLSLTIKLLLMMYYNEIPAQPRTNRSSTNSSTFVNLWFTNVAADDGQLRV